MNQMVLSRLHSPTLFLICFIAITLPVRAEDGNGFTESTEVSARQPTQAPANEISKNLVYRSEYEAVNDLVFDLNDPHEGTVSYCMISGNNDNYYAIDSLTGVVTFTKEIPDVVGEVHKDTLFISVAGYNYQKKYQIVVVDGFDFFIETHPEYKILTKNQ